MLPEWKAWSYSARHHWRKPKRRVWGTKQHLKVYHIEYLLSHAVETFTFTFPKAGIQTYLLQNQITPVKHKEDFHRTWVLSVLQTQPEGSKQIWCPWRFRAAPILSTWTVSRWPNSHGSIPWWTEEGNLRHPTSKCHVSLWGCEQTPMHVPLLAQGSTLQTPVLPVSRARSGLLLASQIQMNDLKLLADDTYVFPSLHLYLGDSCDTDKPLHC